MAAISPNSTTFRPLSILKSFFVKPGRRTLIVAGGLFKGITLELDLQHHTQFYFGLYETETFSVIRKAVHDCSWAVDVGAGAGELSIYLLRQASCKVVHAIEPQAKEVEKFRVNLALNQLRNDSRLIIHEAFAGDGDPTSHLAIDDLNLDLNRKGFLKVDVDGFEVEVLMSSKETLQKGQVDVLVEVHSEALEAQCSQLLRGWGYSVEIIRNAWWRMLVPERRPISHNRWIFCTKPPR